MQQSRLSGTRSGQRGKGLVWPEVLGFIRCLLVGVMQKEFKNVDRKENLDEPLRAGGDSLLGALSQQQCGQELAGSSWLLLAPPGYSLLKETYGNS